MPVTYKSHTRFSVMQSNSLLTFTIHLRMICQNYLPTDGSFGHTLDSTSKNCFDTVPALQITYYTSLMDFAITLLLLDSSLWHMLKTRLFDITHSEHSALTLPSCSFDLVQKISFTDCDWLNASISSSSRSTTACIFHSTHHHGNTAIYYYHAHSHCINYSSGQQNRKSDSDVYNG